MIDPMTIKGSWMRNQTAKALKNTHRILNGSEPIEDNDCFAHPVGYPVWQQVLLFIFVISILFVGGCWHSAPANASQNYLCKESRK